MPPQCLQCAVEAGLGRASGFRASAPGDQHPALSHGLCVSRKARQFGEKCELDPVSVGTGQGEVGDVWPLRMSSPGTCALEDPLSHTLVRGDSHSSRGGDLYIRLHLGACS